MKTTLTVIKPFATRTRRFAAGQPVDPREDLAPIGLDGLKAGGFVAEDNTEATPARAGRKGTAK